MIWTSALLNTFKKSESKSAKRLVRKLHLAPKRNSSLTQIAAVEEEFMTGEEVTTPEGCRSGEYTVRKKFTLVKKHSSLVFK